MYVKENLEDNMAKCGTFVAKCGTFVTNVALLLPNVASTFVAKCR